MEGQKHRDGRLLVYWSFKEFLWNGIQACPDDICFKQTIEAQASGEENLNYYQVLATAVAGPDSSGAISIDREKVEYLVFGTTGLAAGNEPWHSLLMRHNALQELRDTAHFGVDIEPNLHNVKQLYC